MKRIIAATFAILATCLPATADVLDVGGPAPDSSTIAGAILLANDGDVIRVYPGGYGSFTVDGKSLSIVPGVHGNKPQVNGVISIQGLLGNQSVELNGIDATQSGSSAALAITNCAGPVRVRDCTFTISGGPFGIPVPGGVISNSTDVVLTSCSLSGLEGSVVVSGCGSGGPGGPGLLATDSIVALYHCTLNGGYGGFGWGYFDCSCVGYGGKGGSGLALMGTGQLFASLCDFSGSPGGLSGDPFCWLAFAEHGSGVKTLPGASWNARFLNCSAGGCSGCPGYNIGFPSSLSFVPAPGRRMSGPAWLKDDEDLSLSFYGSPGDRVGLFYSTGYDHDITPMFGPLLVHVPSGFNRPRWRYLGVIDASGRLDVTLPMRNIPNLTHVNLHLVGVAVSALGKYYTNSLTPVLLDSSW